MQSLAGVAAFMRNRPSYGHRSGKGELASKAKARTDEGGLAAAAGDGYLGQGNSCVQLQNLRRSCCR